MLPQNLQQANKMSLASTIKDWCETIDEDAFSHLFNDGTEKCLALFRNVTNDDHVFIARLAKAETGLRVEDWDNKTTAVFIDKLQNHKQTAEAYQGESAAKVNSTDSASCYRITFADESGDSITKSFERIETTKRGKLLYNQIEHSLQAMGQAITEQEKRQILMDVLKELC